MMQTAEPWHGYDTAPGIGLHRRFTTRWCFFRQHEMSAVLVVVADVFVHQAFQVAFIENDHMVEQITAAVANPALGNTVLPRTAETGSLELNAEAFYCIDHFFIEL